jgi:hypothetical protein
MIDECAILNCARYNSLGLRRATTVRRLFATAPRCPSKTPPQVLVISALAAAMSNAAEGTGLEPATPYGAPVLQTGRSPIRLPSGYSAIVRPDCIIAGTESNFAQVYFPNAGGSIGNDKRCGATVRTSAQKMATDWCVQGVSGCCCGWFAPLDGGTSLRLLEQAGSLFYGGKWL